MKYMCAVLPHLLREAVSFLRS